MENIRVLVRVRPFLPDEEEQPYLTVRGHQISVGDERQFAFDNIFDMEASNKTVNEAIVGPLVDAFVKGYTVSTIAYGQTGAGKTHTMSSLSSDVVRRVYELLKVNPITTNSTVTVDSGTINSTTNINDGDNTDPPLFNRKPEFRFSAVEVYNEHVSDLIASMTAASQPSVSLASASLGPSLPLREGARCGVYIQGLSEVTVDSEEELLAWFERSTANRRTASTLMNITSSRSHCLLTVTLTHNGTVSRFGLVDLAGSERIKKAYGRRFSTGGIDGTDDERAAARSIEIASRMREGISINSGLLALGNVIVALCERKSHVPYRTSKLTRLLQPMLSGNSKTTMIACVSPCVSSFEETLNTLKYADRAKSIRTTPFQVATSCTTLEDAEKTILWLRKQLEDAHEQLRDHQSLSSYAFQEKEKTRLEEVEELLARERSLTTRLQEDLFNAEYTAMVEVEKRKSLEKRLQELEAGYQTNMDVVESDVAKQVEDITFLDEGNSEVKRSLLDQLEAERDELKALKEEKEADTARLARLGETVSSLDHEVDDSIQEKLSREIESKERLIHQLVQQNEEAAQALEHSKKRQDEMMSVKRRLEEELARAEAKLETTEMERYGKEKERRKLQAHYQQRLRKAEEEVAEYRRKVQEATSLVNAREANAEMIKQLQAHVLEMNDELNRQRFTVREGQQRVQKMTLSHAQEVSQLQKQMRESEAQVARLQVQLQKKEREIARVKNSVTAVNNRRQTVSHHTVIPKNDHSNGRADDIQKDINVELMALANLEKEIDELTEDRDELRKALSQAKKHTGGMPNWKKALKGFTLRLQYVEDALQSGNLNEGQESQYRNEKSDIQKKISQLKSLEPVFAQASKQLEELDDNIDTLQEARKYHLRRVRRLQNEVSTSVEGTVRASDLLRRGVGNNTAPVKQRG
ncbi:kinesin [Trypanosoma theileri]|uniref:Kinesin-like protein n=1 Tax=Trypanosoma theileri TaxID=67003 RepID=A0A1X0NPH9_9TRYP|nr:kinesin [Trypanosoma theileri]ORC86040.1 kinesin [Trypanosoma theileri]